MNLQRVRSNKIGVWSVTEINGDTEEQDQEGWGSKNDKGQLGKMGWELVGWLVVIE